MTIGIIRRINKFFPSADNRSLCIACDHGLMTDPYKSWRNITQVIDGAVQAKVDGILISAGQLERFVARYGKGNLPNIILRTDWTNLLRFYEETTSQDCLLPVDHIEYRRLLSAQEVLHRYGGIATIGFLLVDPDRENEELTIKSTNELIKESHTVGLPCIIEVLPLTMKSTSNQHSELLRRGILTALKMGADVIKMPITEEVEDLCSIIHQAGRLVLALGGSNISDEDLFCNQMKKALNSGVDGLLVGRNVSNSEDPFRLINNLRSIVHSKT